MRILVFNAGSSSLKFGVFEGETQLFKGSFARFSGGHCETVLAGEAGQAAIPDLEEAIAAVPGVLARFGVEGLTAVGHRIAHGGADFTGPVLLDEATLARIEALTPLAPLHNPANLAAVMLARRTWPELPQVGVFDTAFHLTNPARATTYAVPAAWRAAGLRRFGFHGTSHKYVAERAAEALGLALGDLRIISLHLGNGASACAISHGRSLDSSMGMTPLEGLVMGTRSGDVDPGAFGFLHRRLGLDIPAIEAALYEDSGLKALAGSADMRDLEARAGAGDTDAQAAISLYAYRARKYVGAYAAAMGGVDVLVFTGGIGEHSATMRQRICEGLGFMGLVLDHDRNAAPDLGGRAAPQVQADESRVKVMVTETAEQLMIAREAARLLTRPALVPAPLPVAVSGRHVHLCETGVAALFGPGYRLHEAVPLRQPGNWAARERVVIEGPKGRLEHVAILGPLRARTQIEVSRTDSFHLGIDAPVRDSGQLDGTPKVRLLGPAGVFETDGLIVAARHIHINPEEAAARGLADRQMVDVRVAGRDGRDIVFTHTLVRVSARAFAEMHIDTDEANAAGITGAGEGELVKDVDAVPER
jgi:acetate kinase